MYQMLIANHSVMMTINCQLYHNVILMFVFLNFNNDLCTPAIKFTALHLKTSVLKASRGAGATVRQKISGVKIFVDCLKLP